MMITSEDALLNTTEEDRFLTEDLAFLLHYACKKIATYKFQPIFNCHSISRAIALRFPEKVKVIDGTYLGIKASPCQKTFTNFGCHHSWLETQSGSIIDVYPVGVYVFTPLLFVRTGIYHNFPEGRYLNDPEVTKMCGTRDTWRKARILHKLLK